MNLNSHTKNRRGNTQTHIMNMTARSRSKGSTLSTLINPIKRRLGFKKGSRGTNALYRAISAENWELVISICESKPYKAEKWHNAVGFFDAHRSSKILPLHQACIFHPTAQAVKHIIQAFPMALRSKETGYGRVPLHIACHSNASFECIHELIVHYPQASIERDLIGRVPLHYALSNGATEEIVEELMIAAEESCGDNFDGKREICSVADFNGWLPIHVACFMGASANVISILMKAYPEGGEMKTKKNSTPLTLLRGISLSPSKRDDVEAILMGRQAPVKYSAKVSPARTDMEKVVRMSDETCSRGVTLEIDEGETSSLSSMEDGTVRPGKHRSKMFTASEAISKQLQFGADVRRMEGPPDSSSTNGIPFTLYPPQVLTPPQQPVELPTHSIYASSSSNLLPPRKFTEDSHFSQSLDLMLPPEQGPDKRSTQSYKEMESQISTVSSNSSTRKTHPPVFQRITSTAAFC